MSRINIAWKEAMQMIQSIGPNQLPYNGTFHYFLYEYYAHSQQFIISRQATESFLLKTTVDFTTRGKNDLRRRHLSKLSVSLGHELWSLSYNEIKYSSFHPDTKTQVEQVWKLSNNLFRVTFWTNEGYAWAHVSMENAGHSQRGQKVLQQLLDVIGRKDPMIASHELSWELDFTKAGFEILERSELREFLSII
jgi:hypothetical protein